MRRDWDDDQAAMNKPLLQLTDVTRYFFAGDKQCLVLKHLHLSIKAGEFVAIVGASGCGKSTLMNILGCLDYPSTGSYQVEGRETGELDHDELARLRRDHFGFIFQRYHLLSHLSAVMNVEIPALYSGQPLLARRARAIRLLTRLGLAEHVAHRPSQLSGGQQQRVSIARALMSGGKVILADEPTGALDSNSGQEVMAILRELNALGHTVIIVTHDERVAHYAHRIIEMRDGEIVTDRPNLQSTAAYTLNRPATEIAASSNTVVPTHIAAIPKAVVSSNLAVHPNVEELAEAQGLSHITVHSTVENSSKAEVFSNANTETLSHRKVHTNSEESANKEVRSSLYGLATRLRYFFELFQMAWQTLVSHRLRTLLTMLGIVIGIMSVVSIVAIGEGAKHYMLDDINRIGTNTIHIYPGRDWGDTNASSIKTLLPDDVTMLADQAYVDSVVPQTSKSLLVRYRNIDVHAFVSGVSEKFFRVRGLSLSHGIRFNADDVKHQSQVVVIDQNTRRRLFGENVDPLGQVILIGNLPCRVIGVMTTKESMFEPPIDLKIWLPYTTASGRLFGQRHLGSIIVRVRDGQSSQAAEKSLTQLLIQRHGRKDFLTNNLDGFVKMVKKTSQSLALFLALVAVITLIVGGIGVMNIMLVAVTERTREIGIRMAVGARQADIMQQFLIEAVLVCLIAGIIGIVLSFGTSFLFSYFVSQWKMIFTTNAIVAAFLSATLIGIVFGIMPARRASRLNIIDALVRD